MLYSESEGGKIILGRESKLSNWLLLKESKLILIYSPEFTFIFTLVIFFFGSKKFKNFGVSYESNVVFVKSKTFLYSKSSVKFWQLIFKLYIAS